MNDIDPQSRADYLAYWEAKLAEAERVREEALRILGRKAVDND